MIQEWSVILSPARFSGSPRTGLRSWGELGAPRSGVSGAKDLLLFLLAERLVPTVSLQTSNLPTSLCPYVPVSLSKSRIAQLSPVV